MTFILSNLTEWLNSFVRQTDSKEEDLNSDLSSNEQTNFELSSTASLEIEAQIETLKIRPRWADLEDSEDDGVPPALFSPDLQKIMSQRQTFKKKNKKRKKKRRKKRNLRRRGLRMHITSELRKHLRCYKPSNYPSWKNITMSLWLWCKQNQKFLNCSSTHFFFSTKNSDTLEDEITKKNKDCISIPIQRHHNLGKLMGNS